MIYYETKRRKAILDNKNKERRMEISNTHRLIPHALSSGYVSGAVKKEILRDRKSGRQRETVVAEAIWLHGDLPRSA